MLSSKEELLSLLTMRYDYFLDQSNICTHGYVKSQNLLEGLESSGSSPADCSRVQQIQIHNQYSRHNLYVKHV
jgi:hypothetical protein